MADPIRNTVINSNMLESVLVKVVERLHTEYKTLSDTINDTKDKLDALDTSVNEMIIEELTKLLAGADEEFDTLKEISDWIKSDTSGAAKMQSDILSNQSNISELYSTKANKGEYEISKKFVSDVNLNVDVIQPEFSATAEAPEIDFNQTTLLAVNSEVDTSEGMLTFEGDIEGKKLTLTGVINGLVINNTITQPEFEASNAKIDRVRDANVVSRSEQTRFRLYHQVDYGKLTISGDFATPIINNTITQPVYAIESIPQTIYMHRDVDVGIGLTNAVIKEKPVLNLN